MLSNLKYTLPLPPISPALSTSPQPPTPSPSLYTSPPLPPHIPLSISLAPCPVTRCPHCEGDWVISFMSSKGKCDRAAGGKLGIVKDWCYWPSTPQHWPAATLPSSSLCTRDSSSLCQAVSGVTAHERQRTPIPDKQLISVRCHRRHPAVAAGDRPGPAHPASHSIQQNPQSEDAESEMKGVHRCRADSSTSSSVSGEGGVQLGSWLASSHDGVCSTSVLSILFPSSPVKIHTLKANTGVILWAALNLSMHPCLPLTNIR